MYNQVSEFIHSTGVANRFFDLAASQTRYLTQMQLQKLVYFSHGWHLTIYDTGLTIDEPEAWDYGPLYGDLWIATRKYGNSPVIEKIRKRDLPPSVTQLTEGDSSSNHEFCHASLNINQQQLVQRVFEIYGNLGAFDLSALTHQYGTPWYKVYVEREQRRSRIPQDLIKEHFTSIARRNHAKKKS